MLKKEPTLFSNCLRVLFFEIYCIRFYFLDMPFPSYMYLDMYISGQLYLIHTNLSFQIAITPTLFSTSPEARDRFRPRDRGCYVEGELPLEYLPSKYYRYEMSNCLFEAAYEKILEECNCTPRF